jgi:hypothetical protein
MAERKESIHHRIVNEPPAYLKTYGFNEKTWDHPHKNRRAELDHYEQGRTIGAIPNKDPELEQRLARRRQRQMQNELKRRAAG